MSSRGLVEFLLARIAEDEASSTTRNTRSPAKRRVVERGRRRTSVLRTLALVYSEHPEYRDEWRPR